mmetsp:Transcript_2751/g.6653  ORF Transcript_2751/g.6653 Transcript_2751/m.6653 type:complete len:233 (+) Transcript_2751:43-741(+)
MVSVFHILLGLATQGPLRIGFGAGRVQLILQLSQIRKNCDMVGPHLGDLSSVRCGNFMVHALCFSEFLAQLCKLTLFDASANVCNIVCDRLLVKLETSLLQLPRELMFVLLSILCTDPHQGHTESGSSRRTLKLHDGSRADEPVHNPSDALESPILDHSPVNADDQVTRTNAAINLCRSAFHERQHGDPSVRGATLCVHQNDAHGAAQLFRQLRFQHIGHFRSYHIVNHAVS